MSLSVLPSDVWVETTESFVRMAVVVISMVAPGISSVIQIALGHILIREGRLIHPSFVWSFYTGYAIVTSFSLYYFAMWFRRRLYSRRISDVDYPEATQLVNECATQLNIVPPPKLMILKSPSTDCSLEKIVRGHIHLVIGEDVLALLNRDELKAVFIHELSHIKNRDAKFMFWAKHLAFNIRSGIFLIIFLFIALYPFTGPFPSMADALFAYRILFFLGLAYVSIKSVSRIRELLADARATMELESGSVLFSAIRKLAWLEINLRTLESIIVRQTVVGKMLHRDYFPKPIKRLTRFVKKYTLEDHPYLSTRLQALKERRYISNATELKVLSLEASAYIGLAAFFLFIGSYMALSPIVENVLVPAIVVIPHLQLHISDFIPIGIIVFVHLYYLTKYDWIYLSKNVHDILRILVRINLVALFSSLCMSAVFFLAYFDLEQTLSMFWTYTLASCFVITFCLAFRTLISRLVRQE